MKKSYFTTILAVVVTFAFLSKAYGAENSDWEINISAVTANGSSNQIALGQNNNATDNFDGYFDVPGKVEGDISIYFDHENDWNEDAPKYWRDVKAPKELDNWTFTVASVLHNTTVSLSWDNSQFAGFYAITLTDNVTGVTIDMKNENTYAYTNTGVTTFTVNTDLPENIYLRTKERRNRR